MNELNGALLFQQLVVNRGDPRVVLWVLGGAMEESSHFRGKLWPIRNQCGNQKTQALPDKSVEDRFLFSEQNGARSREWVIYCYGEKDCLRPDVC